MTKSEEAIHEALYDLFADMVEYRGSEHGHNYTLYNKENPRERVDYDLATGVLKMGIDEYREATIYLDCVSAEQLKDIYDRFEKNGVPKLED